MFSPQSDAKSSWDWAKSQIFTEAALTQGQPSCGFRLVAPLASSQQQKGHCSAETACSYHITFSFIIYLCLNICCNVFTDRNLSLLQSFPHISMYIKVQESTATEIWANFCACLYRIRNTKAGQCSRCHVVPIPKVEQETHWCLMEL